MRRFLVEADPEGLHDLACQYLAFAEKLAEDWADSPQPPSVIDCARLLVIIDDMASPDDDGTECPT